MKAVEILINDFFKRVDKIKAQSKEKSHEHSLGELIDEILNLKKTLAAIEAVAYAANDYSDRSSIIYKDERYI